MSVSTTILGVTTKGWSMFVHVPVRWRCDHRETGPTVVVRCDSGDCGFHEPIGSVATHQSTMGGVCDGYSLLFVDRSYLHCTFWKRTGRHWSHFWSQTRTLRSARIEWRFSRWWRHRHPFSTPIFQSTFCATLAFATLKLPTFFTSTQTSWFSPKRIPNSSSFSPPSETILARSSYFPCFSPPRERFPRDH